MLFFLMAYEYLDISGDAGIRAHGATLAEVFKDASLGMYSLIVDLEKVKPQKSVKVEVESLSMEWLLIEWLNELIFRFDAYGFIGSMAEIEELGNYKIVSKIFGEDFDYDRHSGGLLIKAATYHGLKIERMPNGWQAEVIFDI